MVANNLFDTLFSSLLLLTQTVDRLLHDCSHAFLKTAPFVTILFFFLYQPRISHSTLMPSPNSDHFRLNRFFHRFATRPTVMALLIPFHPSPDRSLRLSLKIASFNRPCHAADFSLFHSITTIRNTGRYVSRAICSCTTILSRFGQHPPPRQNTTT